MNKSLIGPARCPPTTSDWVSRPVSRQNPARSKESLPVDNPRPTTSHGDFRRQSDVDSKKGHSCGNIAVPPVENPDHPPSNFKIHPPPYVPVHGLNNIAQWNVTWGRERFDPNREPYDWERNWGRGQHPMPNDPLYRITNPLVGSGKSSDIPGQSKGATIRALAFNVDCWYGVGAHPSR
eukprot:7379690-Pyramimonas_sp.AAC.1